MLHVLVGPTCNNNCIFCMEDDRERRREHVSAQTLRDLLAMLSAYAPRDAVLFTSGEPTLSPLLPTLIRRARELGYRSVGLITNGRRLAYREYAEALMKSGLTHLTVSVHGHTARLHDGLTRTRGSFEHTAAGLTHLAALKERYWFQWLSSTVVTRRNLPHLPAIHAFLSALPLDGLVFNVMMARGRGAQHFERLMAPYAEVTAAFQALLDTLPEAARNRLTVMDAPACVTEGLPWEVRGLVEAYQQYEPVGSSGSPHAEPPSRARDRAELLAEASQEYYLAHRGEKDGYVRLRRAECDQCRFSGLCPGVWSPYVERFGWGEFVPVRGGR